MKTKQSKIDVSRELAVDPIKMFPQVEKMLHKQAWKFASQFPIPIEEARAEAYFGFMIACQKYDSTAGVKFLTWCYQMVWWTLKNMAMAGAARSASEICVGLYAQEMERPAEDLSAEFLERLGEDAFWLTEDSRTLLELILTPPADVLAGKRPTPKQLVTRIKYHNFKDHAARGKFAALMAELKSELGSVFS